MSWIEPHCTDLPHTGKRGSTGRGESTAVKSLARQLIAEFQK
jgi:hypothetical protein